MAQNTHYKADEIIKILTYAMKENRKEKLLKYDKETRDSKRKTICRIDRKIVYF